MTVMEVYRSVILIRKIKVKHQTEIGAVLLTTTDRDRILTMSSATKMAASIIELVVWSRGLLLCLYMLAVVSQCPLLFILNPHHPRNQSRHQWI